MRFALALLVLFAFPSSHACSKQEQKTIACWALCRADEFDDGFYIEKTNECGCVRKEKFEDISRVKLRIEKKSKLDYVFTN